MAKQKLAVLIFIFGLFSPLFYVSAGTILSSYKYAWSNNGGYINFENVVVSDSALSGYAWSENYGWIKFNPAQGGVSNNGAGDLSGSAWGERLGWIDFNNVSINPSTGKFSGTATGALIGTITFNCSYCDVRTDWRQNNTPVPASGGGGGGGILPGMSAPEKITAQGVPLVILPEQAGVLIEYTPKGQAILDVPANNLSDKTTFTIALEPLTQINEYLVLGNTNLVNGVFYNISAQDQSGNDIHSFPSPITITLPVPANFAGAENLGVYWLNETNWQWVLIPDAIFKEGKVTFQVNHLTRFAIFGAATGVIGEIQKIYQKIAPSIQLPQEKKPAAGEINIKPEEQKKAAVQQELKKPAVEKISGKYGKSKIFLAVSAAILLIFAVAAVFYMRKRRSKVELNN